jgi:hypothetical protein
MKDKVGQNFNIQTLQKGVIELWKADQASALDLDKALITLRDTMREAHGDFKQWYTKEGLATNRVYYCIRLAEGKVKKSAAKSAASEKPSAVFERAVACAVRENLKGLVVEKLRPADITNLIDKVVSALIYTLRWETRILDTSAPPPSEHLKSFQAGLAGIVAAYYVPRDARGAERRAA